MPKNTGWETGQISRANKIIKKLYLRKNYNQKSKIRKLKKKLLNITWNLIAENTKDTYDWRTDVSNIFIKYKEKYHHLQRKFQLFI